MDEDSRCQADYRSPRLKAGTDSLRMSLIKHIRDGFPLSLPLTLLTSASIWEWPLALRHNFRIVCVLVGEMQTTGFVSLAEAGK